MCHWQDFPPYEEEKSAEVDWVSICQDPALKAKVQLLATEHPNESVRRAAQDFGNSMAYWDDERETKAPCRRASAPEFWCETHRDIWPEGVPWCFGAEAPSVLNPDGTPSAFTLQMFGRS